MVGAKGFENFTLKRVGGKENSVSTLIIDEKELKKLRDGLLEYCGQDGKDNHGEEDDLTFTLAVGRG